MLFTSKQRHFCCFVARLNLCLLFTANVMVIPCLAQVKISPKPELVTDQPDQTESSAVVPPEYTQVETGWSLSRNQEGGIRTNTHALPGTLFRIGVLAACRTFKVTGTRHNLGYEKSIQNHR